MNWPKKSLPKGQTKMPSVRDDDFSKTPKQKRAVVPREGKYPMASTAYEYEYQKAMKDVADKAMTVFPTLSPEMQEYYGSPQGFANMMQSNMDLPVQTTDKEGSSKYKNPGFVNFLAAIPPIVAGQILHNGIPSTGNLSKLAVALGGQPFSSTPTFGPVLPENRLTMALSEVGPYLGAAGAYGLMNSLNPERYKLKGSNQREDLINLMKERGDMEMMRATGNISTGFVPQIDTSEYQFKPNAQEGAYVSDEMGGEEQQQAQMQQVVIKLIEQFKTPEAIQKYLIQQGVDRQALGQVMMMVQQMMQGGGAGQYRDGGMPMEVAVARFKASGRDKGLVGSALDAHVEKMKSQYGYQKGGAVKYTPIQDNEVVELYNNGGGLSYKGMTFPGYNKSIKTPADDKHKFMSIMKKGGKIKLVKYGFRKK
jgi:hypothetical protein